MLRRLISRWAATEATVVEIKTPQDCELLFDSEFAILIKYSQACSFSKQQLRATLQFFSKSPEIKIRTLCVQTGPAASVMIENRTRIRHETPQVIAMRKGKVIAHASHRRIND